MSDYKDNVDKLGSKSKTVAAILKKQWDDLVDERNELLEALKKTEDALSTLDNLYILDSVTLMRLSEARATIEKLTPKPNP